MRVAHPDQVPLIHHDERESSEEPRQGLDQRSLDLATVRSAILYLLGDGGQHEFRVAGARLRPEAFGQRDGVDEIPIVGERQTGPSNLPEGRLSVVPGGRSRGRIAGVTDPQMTG